VRPELIGFGVLGKSKAVKSSTMKGAKALAGKFTLETVPNWCGVCAGG
jgi:hypothetical protein